MYFHQIWYILENFAFESFLVLMNWCNMISKSTIKMVSFPNEHFSQKTKAKKNFYWNYLTLGRKIIQSFFIVKIWNRFSQWNWGNIPKLKYFAADQNSLPVRNHVKLMHVINSRRGFILVDTSYGIGDCRPGLPKGRKYQMVKTQTRATLGDQ